MSTYNLIFKPISPTTSYYLQNEPAHIVITHTYDIDLVDRLIAGTEDKFVPHYLVTEDSVFHHLESSTTSAILPSQGEGLVENSPITPNNSIVVMMDMRNDLDHDTVTTSSAIWFLQDLLGETGISSDRIVRRYDVTGINDPAAWRSYNWKSWWKFKAELGSCQVDFSYDEEERQPNPLRLPTREVTTDLLEGDETGILTPRTSLKVYMRPIIDESCLVDTYVAGESVTYDKILHDPDSRLVWYSYVSLLGKRRYILVDPTKDQIELTDISEDSISPNIEYLPTDLDGLGLSAEPNIETITYGYFFPNQPMKVRIRPDLASDHVFTVVENEALAYQKEIITHGFIWLEVGTTLGSTLYVPYQRYDLHTGPVGTSYGAILEPMEQQTEG